MSCYTPFAGGGGITPTSPVLHLVIHAHAGGMATSPAPAARCVRRCDIARLRAVSLLAVTYAPPWELLSSRTLPLLSSSPAVSVGHLPCRQRCARGACARGLCGRRRPKSGGSDSGARLASRWPHGWGAGPSAGVCKLDIGGARGAERRGFNLKAGAITFRNLHLTNGMAPKNDMVRKPRWPGRRTPVLPLPIVLLQASCNGQSPPAPWIHCSLLGNTSINDVAS